MSYQEALEALKKGKYKDVITWFDGLSPSQRDGKTYALAALAHFQLEQYGVAAEQYDRARQAGGSDSECRDWREMSNLQRSTTAPRSPSRCPNRISLMPPTC